MEEIWKDIIGFEGCYQISNYGRLKSLERFVTHKTRNGITYTDQYVKEKIKVLSKKRRPSATLFNKGKYKKISIARTVLTHFGSEPTIEKPDCMHLDHNIFNNHISNLKWGSHSDNMQMDWRDGRRKAYSHWTGIINEANPHSKPVAQFSLNGAFIKNWPNSIEVERKLKIPSRAIRKCCNNEISKTHGFIFKWKFNLKVT